jgi:hypothetical protein
MAVLRKSWKISPTYFKSLRFHFIEHRQQRRSALGSSPQLGQAIRPRFAAQQTVVHVWRKSRTGLSSDRVKT